MAEELKIISNELITSDTENEVNAVIEKMIEKSKENIEQMCELTLECTAFLSSADSRASALSNQGTFKRILGTVTGKNSKLNNAILKDNTKAIYAAQTLINRVMLECVNNRKLLLAVNDRISDLYLELKEDQNDLAATLLMTRQAIVSFYKQYQEEILAQDQRIDNLENYVKTNCPKCQSELLSWQRVCPYCGYIHPLKTQAMSEKTLQTLNRISEIVKDNELSQDIAWDLTAQRIEHIMHKVQNLAKLGKIPGYTAEIKDDVDNLMNKCRNAEFQIAIVGVMKAGKSYLMNALIGAEIASVEVNPETAALTKFRSANGYYVNIKFHRHKQWKKLKQSAFDSKTISKDSLASRLNDPKIMKMESQWINHEDLNIKCDNLSELQATVKKFTSSQKKEHLFVSEVEVGVDRSIFEMPPEVVFVDTPGLKDPVKYRSDITRSYIKKADAVLIALKPGPLTAEGVEIVTTVLDYTDNDKAFIVGTQKDLNNEKEHEQYVSNWITHLVNAKRYGNERQVINRIILTSAKMELLMKKWMSLSESEKEDESYFSDDDYSDLQNYVAKILRKRRFDLIAISDDECQIVLNSTGISNLRRKLESTLIDNYRQLKVEDIINLYKRLQKQIRSISQKSLQQQKNTIAIAINGAESLQKKIDSMIIEKNQLAKENSDLKTSIRQFEMAINNKIKRIERKVK